MKLQTKRDIFIVKGAGWLPGVWSHNFWVLQGFISVVLILTFVIPPVVSWWLIPRLPRWHGCKHVKRLKGSKITAWTGNCIPSPLWKNLVRKNTNMGKFSWCLLGWNSYSEYREAELIQTEKHLNGKILFLYTVKVELNGVKQPSQVSWVLINLKKLLIRLRSECWVLRYHDFWNGVKHWLLFCTHVHLLERKTWKL